MLIIQRIRTQNKIENKEKSSLVHKITKSQERKVRKQIRKRKIDQISKVPTNKKRDLRRTCKKKQRNIRINHE